MSDRIAAADLPSTRSKASENQEADVELCRDVFAGTRRIREKGRVYLPQSPGEQAGNYAARLKRSAFTNYFRRTVDGLVGLVFAKDPVLGDDVPEPIRKAWENIDNAGTHGDVFSRDLMTDAQITGHAAILVDYPRTDGTQKLDAELTGKIRPYWVPIRKEDIISWRTVVEDGRTVLEQLVLRECQAKPLGEFGEGVQTFYRVFRRELVKDSEGVTKPEVSYQLLEILDGKLFVIDAGKYTTQDEIPVAEVPTSGRRGLFESDPPLLDVAHLNIAHYQKDSDHAYAIHMSAVPILARIGVAQTGEGPEMLVVGPNAAVDLPPSGDLKYVTPAADALDAASKAMEKIVADIGSLGLAMLTPQKRAAETAEAKRLDKATSDSALAVSARALQDALERALGFHAKYLLLEDGGSISVNRDFENSVMEAGVMTAIAALVKAGLPVRLALEMMQQGGRIAEDADLDVLELEWGAGQAASKELDRLDAEERAEEIISEAA